jgi:hypothetical protein
MTDSLLGDLYRAAKLRSLSNEQIGALLLQLNSQKPILTYEYDLLDDAAERLFGARMTPEELDSELDKAEPMEIDVDKIMESVREQIKNPVHIDEEDRLKAKILKVMVHLRTFRPWTAEQKLWADELQKILEAR